MKKSRRAAALVLSLWLFAPFVLAACKNISPTPDTETSLDSPLPESLPSNAEPPASELPEPSETPETPPQVPEETPPTPSTPPAEPEAPPTAQPTPPAATPVVKKAEYARTASSVNIRSGAGTSFSILGNAEKGTSYAILGKVGSWYKIYYRNQTAYISASYATVFSLHKTESKAESVVEEGYKLLGVPYVYGAVRFHDGSGKLLAGFSVQKFDCSSLMQYIFYKGAGKIIGSHTRAQVKQGKYVKPSELKRGDCIFFTNEQRQYNVGIERVGHVALYLGDNYILHTASDYARIEQISAKRWSFYIEARCFV